MTAYPAQDSFVRGEISPRLHARAGIELYRSSLAICENFITLPHGGIRKRAGTYFAGETKNSGEERPWPFIYSEDQAYMLFFGNLYFRVYAYGGPVESSPGVVLEVATPWPAAAIPDIHFEQSGNALYVTHRDYPTRTIRRVDNTTWTVTETTPADGPYEPANIVKTTKVYVSGSTGTVTATASAAIFTAADVGRLLRIDVESFEPWRPWEAGGLVKNLDVSGEVRRYDGNIYEAMEPTSEPAGIYAGGTPPTHLEGEEWDGGAADTEAGTNRTYGVKWKYLHSGLGVGRITAIGGGGTTATITVLTDFPTELVGSGNASYIWRLGALSAERYPRSAVIHEERLFLATAYSVFGSKTFDFTSFRPGAGDTDALAYPLVGTSEITWLQETDGALLIGTIGGVRALTGSGQDEQLTPDSFKNRRSPTKPCSSIQPVKVGSAFAYVPFDRKSVVELGYSYERGGYRTMPLGLISEHIAKQSIASISYAAEPEPIMWIGLENGEAGGMTYEEDQNVRGWHRHRLGGTWGNQGWGFIEWQATAPGLDGDSETWFVVKRTINGQTKRMIEVLQKPFEYGDVADAFMVDCGLTYEGVAANSFSGMNHLAGQTVDVLGDGVIYRDRSVSLAGVVTLPVGEMAAKAHIGLPYSAVAETLELDVGGRDGSITGRRKRIDSVIFSVLETANLYVRSASRADFELQQAGKITIVPETDAVRLFTGNLDPVFLDDTWEGRGRLRIEAPDPVPCTIRALVPGFNSEGG